MSRFKETNYLYFKCTPYGVNIHPSEPISSCDALFFNYTPSRHSLDREALESYCNEIKQNVNIRQIHIYNRYGDGISLIPAPVNEEIQKIFSLFVGKQNLKITLELFDLNDSLTQNAIEQLIVNNPGAEVEYQLCAKGDKTLCSGRIEKSAEVPTETSLRSSGSSNSRDHHLHFFQPNTIEPPSSLNELDPTKIPMPPT